MPSTGGSGSRHVYVPSASRRNNKRKRFHGAFTGGFSAGYFNTVGSKEGWKPRQENDGNDGGNDDVDNDDENEGRKVEKEPTSVTKDMKDDGRRRGRKQTVQRKEDFMDDQDFNEWGGPTSVQESYATSGSKSEGHRDKNRTSKTTSEPDMSSPLVSLSSAAMDWSRVEPPPNVGQRLLKVLGWRSSGNVAYVPTGAAGRDPTKLPNTSFNEDIDIDVDDCRERLLSSRRLKAIHLQQSRVRIPPPKVDRGGLGYDVFHAAPEFQQHKERRRKLAQQKARALTGSDRSGGNRVYRLSDLMGGSHEEDQGDGAAGTRKSARDDRTGDVDDSYAAFETMEDFVGTKTVGGFAIREDDDDVYDEGPQVDGDSRKIAVDTDKYTTEIMDYDSDEPGINNSRNLGREQASNVGIGVRGNRTKSNSNKQIGGLLASWMTNTTSNNIKGTNTDASEPHLQVRGVVTSDGKAPPTGFVLGSGTAPSITQTRYPGPDLPHGIELERHRFSKEEHPDLLGVASRRAQEDERIQQASIARQRRFEEQRQKHQTGTTSSRKDAPPPLGGFGAFTDLRKAFQNRFTSSNNSKNTQRLNESPQQSGLVKPALEDKFSPTGKGHDKTTSINTQDAESGTESKPKKFKVVRSVVMFTPDTLLCKRLGIPAPRHAQRNANQTNSSLGGKEEQYFQSEVLKHIEGTKKQAGTMRTASGRTSSKLQELVGNDEYDGVVPTKATETRPSAEVYRSIFAGVDDESDSDDETDGWAADSHQSEKEADSKLTENNAVTEPRDRQGISSETRQDNRTVDAMKSNAPMNKQQIIVVLSSDETDLDAPSTEDDEKEKSQKRRGKKDKKKSRKRRRPEEDASEQERNEKKKDRKAEKRKKKKKRKKHIRDN